MCMIWCSHCSKSSYTHFMEDYWKLAIYMSVSFIVHFPLVYVPINPTNSLQEACSTIILLPKPPLQQSQITFDFNGSTVEFSNHIERHLDIHVWAHRYHNSNKSHSGRIMFSSTTYLDPDWVYTFDARICWSVCSNNDLVVPTPCFRVKVKEHQWFPAQIQSCQ